MPILSAIGAGFGSDKVTPKYLAPGLNKPLTTLTKNALASLNTGGAAAENAFNAGTAKQAQLVGDQENVLRQLLARRLGANPQDLLRSVGQTAFSFIDPNVVAPLARFDVNSDRLRRLAAGLSPGAIDSTAQRLRDARNASGRYYDVARQVYGALPSLYNQVFNAGVTSDEMAGGYLPTLMSAYRRLDRAPLEAAELRSSAATSGAGNVGAANNALRSGVYGYQKDRNIWDRLGAVDTSMWNSLQEAIQMAASVYGMVGGGGAGGALGGLMGGGGGWSQPSAGGSSAKPEQPRFIPAPSQQYQAPLQYQPESNWWPGSYQPQSIAPGAIPQYPQYNPYAPGPSVPTTFG